MTHEFRKLMNLFENDNSDVEFEYTGTTKSKTLAGEFDKVTARLSGPLSAKFTKIAKDFARLDELTKEMKELKQKANKEGKEAMEGLFGPENAFMTRVALTKSVFFQMAKDVADSEVDVVNVNIRGFIRDMKELLDEDLYQAAKDLYRAHKTIGKHHRAGRQGGLSVDPIDKLKVKEDVGMDQSEEIVDVVTKLTNARMQSADSKIQKLKSYLV